MNGKLNFDFSGLGVSDDIVQRFFECKEEMMASFG